MFNVINESEAKKVVGGKSSVIATSVSAIASRVASESDDNGKTVYK